jgi:predicted nucleic acid-binding Zn ribbon protein
MKRKRTYSTKRIEDEFTSLKISRERKRQLRRVKAGLCIKCSDPIAPGEELCVKHRIQQALQSRKKRNSRHPIKGKWVGAGNL